jgi:hypothetical protein
MVDLKNKKGFQLNLLKPFVVMAALRGLIQNSIGHFTSRNNRYCFYRT